MNVERSLTYVFEDDAWVSKIAIGGVLFFIPIFGWLVIAGYWSRLVRQVYLGMDLPLPAWNDFGGDFVRGLKLVLVGIVWALPLFLLQGVMWCVIFLAIGASGNESSAGALASVVLTLGMVGAYGLFFVLQLLLTFVQPLFVSRLAVTESVGAALDFAGIIREAKRYPIPLLIVLGLQFALNFLAFLGFFLCFIGIVFTIFATYLMAGHLYGQVRRIVDGQPDTAPGPRDVLLPEVGGPEPVM